MSQPRPPPATAKDVARIAGVSQSAVSRSFTPGANVSDGTRKKVLKAANELGYRPNAIARSLITRRSGMVGVVIGNLANPFFASALEELARQLAGAGLRLLLFAAFAENPLEDVIHYQIDALIMVSIPVSPTLAAACAAANVPIILFNRTDPDPTVPSVNGDNAPGGSAIAAYLLAGRHERIAFLAGLDASTASRDREQGFTAYLAEQQMAVHTRERSNYTAAETAAAIRRLLLRPDRPDALFCANDQMAIIAVDVAQAEFGLEVGRDISIVGFEDVPQANWPGMALTTYSQPVELMVKRTLEIIERLRSGEQGPVKLIVPGELVIRATTRRPGRRALRHDDA